MALGAHMHPYSYIYYAPHRDGVLQPKTCLQILIKICVCPFCKLDSLKFVFGLNHCKCTDRTSNKSGFLSPDIVHTMIDDKSKD